MWTIVRREFLDHLQSMHFVVLAAVSIVLFVVNGVIFSTRFNHEMAWYTRSVTVAREHPSTVSTDLYVAPGQLLFVAEGGEGYRPAKYTLQPKGALTPLPTEAGNYKMPESPELDWAFIVKVLFSLYVILLGFDAISGEKEEGTLRQMLSQPLGRFTVLAAKYVAIVLTVAVPLLIGLLISLIIAGYSNPVIFGPALMARAVSMGLLAAMYLSVFALLSLLISSLIHQSSIGLLALLALWVCFAVIVPNTSGIVSEEFADVPSEYQAAKQLRPMIQQQIWEKIGKVMKRVKVGELTSEDEVKRETDRVFEEGQNDLVKHFDAYRASMKARAALARTLSRVSPNALFEYAAENIAGTGPEREERFVRDAQAYSATYDGYIFRKMGKLVAVSNFSFVTNVEINGTNVMISSPRPEEYHGKMSDFPQFHENAASVAEGLGHALSDLTGLLLWNIVLALSAFGAVMRTDVR